MDKNQIVRYFSLLMFIVYLMIFNSYIIISIYGYNISISDWVFSIFFCALFYHIYNVYNKENCYKIVYKGKINGNIDSIKYYGKSAKDVEKKFQNEFNNLIILNIFED